MIAEPPNFEQVRRSFLAEFIRYGAAPETEFESIAATLQEQPRASSWRKDFRSEDESFFAMVIPYRRRDPVRLLLVLLHVRSYPPQGTEEQFLRKTMDPVHQRIQAFLPALGSVRFHTYDPAESEVAAEEYDRGGIPLIAKGIIDFASSGSPALR